nr:MAG TPA: NADAR protein [Crassvirales sp.]
MVEYTSCTIIEGVLNPKHYLDIIIGRHEYRGLLELFTFMFRHRSYTSEPYNTEFETEYFPDMNALADCLEGAIILVAEYNNEFLHKLLSPEYKSTCFIYEDPKDPIPGVIPGKDHPRHGKGLNLLGEILTRVKDEYNAN